jgi:transposase
MKITDARSLPAIAQEDLRRKAVKAVEEGKTHDEAGKLFGVARQTISKWVKLYREGGSHQLKARRQGRPKGRSLQPWQAAQTVRAITDRHPDQLKLPFFLWTREAVARLIEDRYGVVLSVWTVGRYLKDWGFTPQKPLRRAFEQDPEAVRRWLEEVYPAIRKQAKKAKAQIYWGDEMGMRSDHQTGTSYGRKGVTPVIPGTGQRFRCNMISAITNRGKLFFMVYRKGFSAKVFIAFLRRLIRQMDGKLFLIVDGHPAHRSNEAKKWVLKQEGRVHLFYLPGYSPELNPDEILNQDVKSNAVGRKRPRSQTEMMSTVRSFLRSRQKQPKKVKCYFHEKHVQYAAL